MDRLLLIIGIFVIISGRISLRAGPLSEPSPESLVLQLASDRYVERESAAEQLRRCGRAALPALDQAAQSAEDLDTRVRAGALAETIRREIENRQRLAVEPIVLNYLGVPLATVVVDFQKRTGIPVQLDSRRVHEPLRPIRLQTGPLPPWEALEAICEVAELHEIIDPEIPSRDVNGLGLASEQRKRIAYSMAEVPRLSPGDLPIILADGKKIRLPGQRSGAVRIQALPGDFPANRVIRGAGEVLLHLDVVAVPKLHWLGVDSIRILRVRDEAGRTLSASYHPDTLPGIDPSFALGIPMMNRILMENALNPVSANLEQPNPRLVPLRLQVNDRNVRRLREFEGVIIGEIVQINQPLIQIDDLPGSVGAGFDAGSDSRLTLLSFTARPAGGAVIRLRADYPNPWSRQRLGLRGPVAGFGILPPPFGGRISLGDWGHIQFVDASGQTLRHVTVSNSQMTDDGIRQIYEMELTVPPSSPLPSKMMLVGNKSSRLEVPFRLTDVACP